ncbi:hypothetical protein CROQUDRAFT_107796 [Cronartium quercuum f. sp. fusiforme G11]|uniref:RNA-dependent RNA polymerase n=1 Tax=Cronartium quercuum f. sp. fusiforme G11 TaxID=708437 RepID=A0A9P6NK03_9BASI|nr:hypothetical protein CROQUDRAFT_107796 [Cronartium quercuum f. sp. fusiforme G11]
MSITIDETIILSNEPILETFNWINIYEIARIFHIINNSDQIKNKPKLIINSNWSNLNPIKLKQIIIDSLNLNENLIKTLKPNEIPLHLKVIIDQFYEKNEMEKLNQLIEFSMLLKIPEENNNNNLKSLRIEILVPELKKLNNSLYRFSDDTNQFLKIKISDLLSKKLRSQNNPLIKSLVINFFCKPLRIGNRVYHTFLRKDDVVYMIHIPQESDKPDWSAVAKFIDKILSIELNPNMTLAKWVARCSLVVSATSPTIDFNPQNIRRVPDLYSNSLLISHDQMGLIVDALGLNYLPCKVGKSEIMTDGAASISHSAALKFCPLTGDSLESLASVYQGRIGFAKGLWYLDPTNDYYDKTVWIEVRDSQWKAESHSGFKFHFNLCRKSGPVTSASIGSQQLLVLTSRGVPVSALEDLLKKYIKEVMDDLSVQDPIKLANSVSKMTSLVSQRKGNLKKLNGIQHDPTCFRINKTNNVNSSINNYTTDSLNNWVLSPSSNEEQLICLLSSGFSKNNRYVVSKVRALKDSKIRSLLGLRVPIGNSTYVYVMPDPTGTLNENEAFLQFTDFRNPQGLRITTLVGPALVSRSPCVLPTDIRKVEMVTNDDLRGVYFNVLVCSIHGKRSLLSLLSGGDYDGDTALVVWESTIVEPFKNWDVETYVEPNVDRWFDSVLTSKIQDNFLNLYLTNSEAFVKEAQNIILNGLFTSKSYAVYAENYKLCEYILGANHDLTQKMGWIYVQGLDAAKQGLTLKEEKDKELQELLKNELTKRLNLVSIDTKKKLIPKYDELSPRSMLNSNNSRVINFQRNNSVHILDALQKILVEEQKEIRTAIKIDDDQTHRSRASDRDYDLCELFKSQLNIFESGSLLSRSDSKNGTMKKWSNDGVRYGVLRRIKTCVQDLKDLHAQGKADKEQELENDLLLQEHGDYTPTNIQKRGEAFRYKKIIIGYHENLTWEAAYDLDLIDEQQLKSASQEQKHEYLDAKKAYLNGLGPDGYNLLKASCAAAVSNAEGFFPYMIAFREICYLKAVATSQRDPRFHKSLGNERANLEYHQNHPRVPFTLEPISALASTVRPMVVTRIDS